MTRVILAGLLSLAGLALCGCCSSQVPPWAIAAAQNQYDPERMTTERNAHVPLKQLAVRPTAVNVGPADATNVQDATNAQVATRSVRIPARIRPPSRVNTRIWQFAYKKPIAVRKKRTVA